MSPSARHSIRSRNTIHAALGVARLFGILAATLLSLSTAIGPAAAAEPTTFVLFHTGDIHGHMTAQPDPTAASEPRPLIGGYAAMATALRQERLDALSAGARTLLIDGGDTFQGTPVVDETSGLCMIAAMNHLRTSFATIGNHDFDYGIAGLASAAAHARHPILACNVFSRETGRLLPFLRPYVRVGHRGVEIAFIGLLTPETARISLAENIAGVEFRDPVPILEKLIPELRSRGVDHVVLLTHVGLEDDKKLADRVPGIDLILGSHSHTPMTEPFRSEKRGVPIIHDAFDNRVLGKITFSAEPGRQPAVAYEPIHLYIASYSEDPAMQSLVASYQTEIDRKMSVVIGTSSVDMVRGIIGGDSPQGSFIADAMRAVAKSDFAVMNIGGVRYPIWKGPVTKNDLFLLQPFLNYVDVVTMTGSAVVDLFEKSLSVDFTPVNEDDNAYARSNFRLQARGLKREFQGQYGYLVPSNLRITYDPSRPAMQRIIGITDDAGTPIDPKRQYTMALNSYMSTGGDGYTHLKELKRNATGVLVRDAIETYIRDRNGIPTLPPVRMHNTALTVEPAP
ncbi:MAG TPA: bifunctional UDP-sugar hydrolase/5'-nucleotidase [Candidatus Ozemobacteraceae bacterium]|nr:bifunctional UDP-sugar hydrolase/5'-nucleotidase [Candidatus Ozemobacteraceae bacterium]